MRNIDRYDPAYPAYPWVLKTAFNHIRNLRRRQGREVLAADEAQRRGAEPGLPEEEMFRVLMQSSTEPPTTGPTAADLLALADGEDRELLELRYLDGLEYSVLAERYGAPEATIRKRVSRAKRRVREAYLVSERFAREDD